MVKHHAGRESIPHHISSVVASSTLDIEPRCGASSRETYNVWQPRKAQQCPLLLAEQKALSCQKAPIWSQRERLHCSPSLHFSSTTPSSCCAGLAARRGFFILVSLLEVKVPWDVESEETLPCFPPPPSFFLPPFPAVPLGQRAARFIFHEKRQRAARWRRRAEEVCAGTQSHV